MAIGLRDHKDWLDLNVVPDLRQDRTLTCRLVGSASNDKAGVAYNGALARRRAEKVKKYLLQQGVAERQITPVSGVLDTASYSTDPHDRSVDVFVETPVNRAFGIRVVAASALGLPPELTELFFRIHDSNNRLQAYYLLVRDPIGEPPLVILPGNLNLSPSGDYDPFFTSDWVSLRDFNGARITLAREITIDGQPISPLTATLSKPGLFMATFIMAHVADVEMEDNPTTGTLRLVGRPTPSGTL